MGGLLARLQAQQPGIFEGAAARALAGALSERPIVELNRPAGNLLQTATEGGEPAAGRRGDVGGNDGLSSLLQSLQQLQKQGNGAS